MTAPRTFAQPPDGGDLAARFRAAAPTLTADPAAIVARGRRRRRTARVATAALTVAAVAAVATAAVGLLGPTPPPPADTAPPEEAPGPVSLWLSAERVPPGGADLVAVLVSNDGTEAMFGVEAALERWDGDSWKLYRRTNLCPDHWHCSSLWYPPGAPEVQGAPDLGLPVGPEGPGPVQRFTVEGLEPGWYRVVQGANEGVVAHGVFEVADDAPAPVPLWPVDGAAVAVQPPLLAPDGGDVALVPLVPPVDGTLTAGMLEAAMSGLADAGVVQRWGAAGWAAVGDVALGAPEAVSVPGELRATVPALEPGAYRVLLRGNGKELMGSFWVRGPTPTSTAAPTPAPTGTAGAACGGDDTACLLDAWLARALDAAGYSHHPAETRPQPEQPYGARAVEVASTGTDLADTAGVLVTTADGPDLGFDDLTVEGDATVGDLTVLEGVTADGSQARARFDCGGFRFLVRGNLADDAARERTWQLAEAVAAGVGPCPADVAGLATLLGVADDDADADASDDALAAPCHDMPAPLCAVDLWLVDSIEAAGYRHGGGEHDIGAVATDTVLVGDWVVSAAAWPLDADVAAGFETGRTTTVGTLTVEHWTADGHGPESRFVCGGFRLAFSIGADAADSGSAAQVAGVAEAVAAAIGECPASEDALVARYADAMQPAG